MLSLSNTQQRIFSALVMTAIVGICFYLGQSATKILIIITGLITSDELITNFLEKKRKSKTYLINMGSFLALSFSFFLFKQSNISFFNFFLLAIALNGFLLSYLFITKIEALFLKKLLKSGKLPIVFFLFPTFSTMLYLVDRIDWLKYLVILLVLTFMTDTGAWFFGKRFGKHKLWSAISPNKTIEGLIGGVLSSAIFSTLTYYFLFDSLKLDFFPAFLFLSLISHLGDLIQSKIKREFEIKDSSALIPGHGGVYDRIDSLIFICPFFIGFMRFVDL